MFDIGNPTETMYITFYRLKDVQAWLNGWDAMQIYKIKNGLMKKV